jgi:hypothetical protein
MGTITHRIILCLNTKEWNPDSKHRVGGSGVAVVSSFGGIAPSGTLQGSGDYQNLVLLVRMQRILPVELVEVGTVPDCIHINAWVFGDFFGMAFPKLT